MPTHFERMLQLADEIFDAKSDASQIQVNEEVLDHLRAIHPACVSADEEGDGPVAWVLVIPTTTELMKQFMQHEITERELFEQTPLHASYEALYLCSAMVLQEFRQQGLAKQLAVRAIEAICKDHSIQSLFVWTFSKEGLLTAQSIAKKVNIPLSVRE